MTVPANNDAALVPSSEGGEMTDADRIKELKARGGFLSPQETREAIDWLAGLVESAAERADEAEKESLARRDHAILLLDRAEAAEAALLAAQQERDKEHRNMDFYRRMAIDEKERAERAERANTRLLYIAEHLFQMVPQEVWREHGAEWQGQYEGDYHAEQLREELAGYRAALADTEQESG